LAFKEHPPVVGAQHAGDDFDGGGFACAVGAEKAHDLAGRHLEAHVFNGGNAAVTAVKVLQLKHEGYLLVVLFWRARSFLGSGVPS
jgi:hypothetical protein